MDNFTKYFVIGCIFANILEIFKAFFFALFQLLHKIFFEMQSKLPEKRGKSKRYEKISGWRPYFWFV